MANSAKENRRIRQVARNLTASRLLYRVSTIVRVESEDDIPFWQHVFSISRPGQKVKFLPSETGSGPIARQRGKTVCMRYVGHLNKNFVICVDSDFDSFTRPGVLDKNKFIFQTYTYSFENHHCWIHSLQQYWASLSINDFDFEVFLTELSHILYPVLIEMLTIKAARKKTWNLTELCGIILSSQVNKKGRLDNNGQQLLNEIKSHLATWSKMQTHPTKVACDRMSTTAVRLGLTKDTAYLYMQGHCIFDLVLRIGNVLCNKKRNFLYEVLDPSLIHCKSAEMKHVIADLK